MPDPIPSSVTYGTVIIGGSPAMLLESILQTQMGNGPVIVIEANDQLGGSWSPQARFGHRIDNGPHLLYNFNTDMSQFFATLTRFTGCRFEKMRPAPHSDSRLNPAMMEFSFGMRGALMRKCILAMRAVLARHWLPVLQPFKYFRPEGGLSAIVAHFEGMAVSLGVDIRLSSPVETLEECSDGRVQVTLDTGEIINGRAVKASAASLPRLADLPSYHILADLHWRTYGQAYIYVRRARQNVFSFFRCFSHPRFFLAADLTSSAQPPLPDDCVLLSVNLTSGQDAQNVTEAEIYAFLAENQLIQGKCGTPEIVAVEWETIAFPVITEEVVDRINTDFKLVEFIHCHNLVRTLYARLEIAQALK